MYLFANILIVVVEPTNTTHIFHKLNSTN